MMSSIDKLLDRLKAILEELHKGNTSSIKVSVDRDAGIVRIYSEGSDYIKRASSGLAEILELGYSTAEHHPYWAILYNAAEICKTILDKWESDLTADQLSEMSWRCEEIKMTLGRLGGQIK
jgi:hypothetical protein